MKIVLLGDLHFVSPNDPDLAQRQDRAHFAEAWPSFDAVVKAVRKESPDMIISVGDIVDYFSPENLAFAQEQLSRLPVPCLVTPGNHDYSGASSRAEVETAFSKAGFPLENRVLSCGDTGILLYNTGLSKEETDACPWLDEHLPKHSRNILCTHVPPDLPQTREAILSVQPDKPLAKYVRQLGRRPFETLLPHLSHVFSGHVHFPAQYRVATTEFQLLPLSVRAANRNYPGMGAIHTHDLTQKTTRHIQLPVIAG
ncbi:MAG: metallophosphoesterase [Opitutales bacterium]|nr:metallophosphoesterase [Opitutales bacterium]